MTAEPDSRWRSVLLLGADIVLMVITFGAYRPSGSGEARRAQSWAAAFVVIVLAFLAVGALLTGKLK